MPVFRYLFVALSFLPLVLTGQADAPTFPPSNLRKITVLVSANCLLVQDSLSILPSSVSIQGDTLTALNILDIQNNQIRLKDDYCSAWQGKSIKLQYRVFPFNLARVIQGIDSSKLVKKDIQIRGAYGQLYTPESTPIIENEGLQYRGSFGRGLSVGNNQSFVLNSNFDLQLQGEIGNDIKVIAAISDENLPIQAQGNTQQLQEFDRVFIQLSKGKSSLIAGDYDMRNGNGYFMQYYKKLKGLSANSFYSINDKVEARTRAGFAISRGKFARQIIQNQEGNQGPYKLAGNNNERFIIVLSGTEKVYFNGILLKRGFDLDYVIDYNRAEITFSPTRVVARDSRIIIEFEYTDVNYVRTLYETNSTFSGSNWEWNLNMYSEQDSKSQTGNVTLDSTDIRILEESGDDLTKMTRSSIRLRDTSLQNPDVVLYKLEDDPVLPGNKILVFTTNLDSANYTAVFTEVGPGKGDYDIDNSTSVNGRVYRYVGQNMGKYAPKVQLIPPEQKQLFTTGGHWNVSKKLKITGEAAMSRFDVNTRSPIGNDNNTGFAGVLGLQYQTKLDSSGHWKLATQASYENIGSAFQPLNPFRNAEFARDWNIAVTPAAATENLLSASVTLQGQNAFSVQYGTRYFSRQGLYRGLKQTGQLNWTASFFQLNGNISYLESDNLADAKQTSFLRPNIKVNIFLDKAKNWVIQSELDAENNVIRDKNDSKNLRGSAAYQHYKLSAGNNPDRKISVRAGINRRYDQLPSADTIKQAAVADEWEIIGKWDNAKGNFFQFHVTRRDLQVLEPGLLPAAKNTRSLIGKVENQLIFWKKAFKTNWVYAVTSGQEPKIEYKFVKLETGRGDFVYIGQNESPNLSMVQDFRFNPSDPLANYIRVSLYNNEFIRTNNLELNQSFRADLDKLFIPSSEMKKLKKRLYTFFARFSLLSTIRVQKRIQENTNGNAISYFNFSRLDTGLVAYTGSWNHTLFFNRGNIYFDMQIGQRRNDTRVVQVNGYEDRAREDVFLRTRIRLHKNIDLLLNAENGNAFYASKIFAVRDFDIDFINLFPELNWRPDDNSRVVSKYTYSRKQQTILGREKATEHKLTAMYTWRKASLFSIESEVNYVRIQFNGEPNSSIEYDLLEGLKNGNNFVWNIRFTRRMAKSIDLTLNYEGRKPGENPVIHVGQAQLKATF